MTCPHCNDTGVIAIPYMMAPGISNHTHCRWCDKGKAACKKAWVEMAKQLEQQPHAGEE